MNSGNLQFDQDTLHFLAAMQEATASALALPADESGKMALFLQELCRTLPVQLAIYWRAAEEEESMSRLAFGTVPGSAAANFVEQCTPRKLGRSIGLAGRAWQEMRRQSAAIDEATADMRLAAALEFGLTGAVAVPVLLGSRVHGIIELFDSNDGLPQLTSALDVLAVQTGYFLRLQLNEIELRENEMLFRQMSGNIQDMAGTIKEAARKERAIVEHALDVICSIDSQLNIVKINPAAVRVLGREPKELTGHCLTEFLDEQEITRTEDYFSAACTSEEGISFEGRFRRQDGRTSEVRWSIHWSQTESAFFCVVHDISERKEMERLRREFVAMISHDLRTPLMSVIAVLQILQEGLWGELDQKGVKKVRDAQSNINFAVYLLNSILDLERFEAGKSSLELLPASVSDIVEQALQTVAPLAEKNSICLLSEVQDQEVEADETRLVQALVNLLGNAIKFTPTGGTITVSSSLQPEYVEISVADTGRGIPEDQLQHVFERFHQVQKDDATGRGGKGLGLAICKQIVEMHDGKIGVDSRPDEGSRFWFRLPRKIRA